MNRLGIAAVLWLVAAGLAIATTLIFRIDPVQWVVTMAVGVVAAVLGLWLVARPSALVGSASNVVAVVWTVLYAVLTVQQADELAAWMTDVFLMVMGAAAGAAAYRGSESEDPRNDLLTTLGEIHRSRRSGKKERR